MATWGIARAKAQLSEVMPEAKRTGPQKVVSMEEWQRLLTESADDEPEESIADFIMNSPFHGIKIPNFKLRARKFEP